MVNSSRDARLARASDDLRKAEQLFRTAGPQQDAKLAIKQLKDAEALLEEAAQAILLVSQPLERAHCELLYRVYETALHVANVLYPYREAAESYSANDKRKSILAFYEARLQTVRTLAR